MVSLPYPKGNDRATVVKGFVELVESFGSKPGFRAELLKDAARYLQEAEDLRAPAAQAVNEIQALRRKIHAKYPKASVLTILDSVGALLYRVSRIGQTETFEEPFVAAPTTPRQAVAGLSEAIQEADEAADRANKALTAELGDIKDALDEMIEPGPPDVATVDYLTNEGPGIIDRAIAAIDGNPADKVNSPPKFAVPDIKVYAEREIARIAKEFDIDLTAFATKATDPAPVWVVKEPGVRVLTGTSFEMRVAFNGNAAFIHMFRDGGLFGDSYTRFSVAEEAVAEYINTNRETLVAFGFIPQE